MACGKRLARFLQGQHWSLLQTKPQGSSHFSLSASLAGSNLLILFTQPNQPFIWTAAAKSAAGVHSTCGEDVTAECHARIICATMLGALRTVWIVFKLSSIHLPSLSFRILQDVLVRTRTQSCALFLLVYCALLFNFSSVPTCQRRRLQPRRRPKATANCGSI